MFGGNPIEETRALIWENGENEIAPVAALVPIFTGGFGVPPNLPDFGENYENVRPAHRREYTLNQMHWDLEREMERREMDYYWDMSVEFDDLIDNYFVDEVPSWFEWREGWRDFVCEFGGLMDYYFEEDWDEECWNW